MDIDGDVVFSILLWLPVSVLLRFKLVCKSWRSLIESSDFAIAQYLHHQHHDHVDSWNLITLNDELRVPPPSCHNKNQSDTFYDDLNLNLLYGNNFQLSRNLGFTFRFQSPIHTPKIISSCHGIICLDLGWEYIDGHYPDIALWNPAIRQFKILPEPPAHIPKYNYFLTYGLGFDSKKNDYKVVRILIYNHWRSVKSDTPIKSRTDVYSLRTNSWKTIDALVPVEAVFLNTYVPFQDGIYCWLGNYLHEVNGSPNIYRTLIFSFHFSSEEFSTVPVPDVFDGDSVLRLFLSFLNEKISCLVQLNPPHCFTTDIWVLNQYGVADSWTKLYSVTLENLFYPFGFSKNGKIFWVRRLPSQGQLEAKLILFDPVTHELNILPVEQPSQHLQVAHYKESLVSINGAIGASPTDESDIYVDFF